MMNYTTLFPNQGNPVQKYTARDSASVFVLGLASTVVAYQIFKEFIPFSIAPPTQKASAGKEPLRGGKQKTISKSKRSRICIELAILPTRFIVVGLNAPILLQGFQPLGCFDNAQINMVLASWWLVSAAYAGDVFVGRPEVLSFIHHFGTMCLALWIHMGLIAPPTDVFTVRFLSIFLFFGVSIGGTCTTGLWITHKYLLDVWPRNLVEICSAVILWSLTFCTTICGLYASAYILKWKYEAYEGWGNLSEFVVLLVVGELWMQWNWVFMWHGLHKELVSAKAWKPEEQSYIDKSDKSAIETNERPEGKRERDRKLGSRMQVILLVLCSPCILSFAYIYYLLAEAHVLEYLGTPEQYTFDDGSFCHVNTLL